MDDLIFITLEVIPVSSVQNLEISSLSGFT